MHEQLLASKYAFRLLICKYAPLEEDEEKENRRRGTGRWGCLVRNAACISTGNRNIYFSESSQTVPSRPSGIGGWWQCGALGNGLLNYGTRESR